MHVVDVCNLSEIHFRGYRRSRFHDILVLLLRFGHGYYSVLVVETSPGLVELLQVTLPPLLRVPKVAVHQLTIKRESPCYSRVTICLGRKLGLLNSVGAGRGGLGVYGRLWSR